MRILYGVVGEGMGHATRSRVVLSELVREHEVQIVASGRAAAYLADHFPDVRPIWGLTMAYEDNEVRLFETLVQNLRGAVSGWPQDIREYYRLVEEFMPEVVVTDFEAFAALFGKRHRLPVICVDNIQMLDRCRHDGRIVEGYQADFALARALVAMKVPRAFHYVVTTFFFPPVRRRRTTLVPSILRDEIVRARPERGDHLLVYQTASGSEELTDALAATGVPCRVYGIRRDLADNVVEGNLTYRPFSERGFVEDLRTARALVAGGGFTTLSEAVYLRKPVLSIPLGGQFEQVLNARYLERLGYGAHAERPSVQALESFLARLPEHEAALAGYEQDGNRVALETVDRLLAEAADR